MGKRKIRQDKQWYLRLTIKRKSAIFHFLSPTHPQDKCHRHADAKVAVLIQKIRQDKQRPHLPEGSSSTHSGLNERTLEKV